MKFWHAGRKSMRGLSRYVPSAALQQPWKRKLPRIMQASGARQEAATETEVEGSPDTLTFQLLSPYPIKYEIVSRSTFGIYQYLGGVLRNREDMIMLRVVAGIGTSPFLFL